MTAPAVVAPVVVPAAPAPLSADAPSPSYQSALDRIITQSPMPDGTPVSGTPATVEPAPAAPGADPEQATAAPADPTAAPAETAASEPTGPVGEVVVDDGEIVLTAERNADGTFKTQIDPSQKFDIKIRDPETGETKVYSKTVPEVLRMAKDGVWGQKVRDEVKYYRDNVETWQQTHETLRGTVGDLQAQLDAQMELNRELLTADEELVVRRRDEYAAEMSPEKRLARLEEDIAERDRATARTAREQKDMQAVTSFANARLVPAIQQAEAMVGTEMVQMKLALDLIPFQVNGKVPPEKLAAVEAHLNGPFMQWAKAEAARRSAIRPEVQAQLDAARAAEVRAQTVVNQVGRQIAPVGTAGADPAPKVRPKNVHDAIESIITRPMASSAG